MLLAYLLGGNMSTHNYITVMFWWRECLVNKSINLSSFPSSSIRSSNTSNPPSGNWSRAFSRVRVHLGMFLNNNGSLWEVFRTSRDYWTVNCHTRRVPTPSDWTTSGIEKLRVIPWSQMIKHAGLCCFSYLFFAQKQNKKRFKNGLNEESNLGPLGYELNALTTALLSHRQQLKEK